jgi:hypothetical protein
MTAASRPDETLNLIQVANTPKGWTVFEGDRALERRADEEAAIKAALAICDRRFDEGVRSQVSLTRVLRRA